MAEGTRAQEWRREMISLLQDFEQRWEQKQSVLQQESETRNNQMMMDIKAMLAGLSLQNNELAGNRGQSSNTPMGNRFNSPNRHSWHHSTKLEFPRFDGNDLETWLLKTEYYFEVVNVLPESIVKVAALHLEGVREDKTLSFFLSGLIDELQMPVRMFKPQTLAEAYALAKL
ncbi:hypothetical protein GH714_003181 [Hevea brasiliensis]|uniref:Retrotransposon gag domain-containing protein n=1 Tax=Hevea brasiliensis TaxID=3981 RepID=A0A6A6NBB4_HEVBR|nr:hypothetical protein GH714_003181 [Hevea brasiliensis]